MPLGAPPAPIHVELREPGDAHARSLACNDATTIAQVKHAMPALWQPHTLDPHGVRCIHRGQVLNDDVRLDTLPRDDAHRLVLHVSIRPGALQHAATPQPAADAPASPAAQPDDPLLASGYFRAPSNNPLCEFVVRVKPSELVPLAHALAITHACYARYYDALARATHSDARAPRLVRPIGMPWEPVDEALHDAALRAAAVTLVEREVMQWTPLQELSAAPAASLGDVRARQAAIDARLGFLNDALLAIVHLHDTHTWRAQAPSVPPPVAHAHDPWELAVDVGVAARTVLGLVLRMVVLVSLFTLRAPHYVRWCAGAALAVYAVVHGVMLVHARRRARVTPTTPARTSASALTAGHAVRDAAAADADTGAAMLELPHLPSRAPVGPWWAPTRWEQALAYYGLADEEQAMGFVHDATRDPVPRIHWARHDFGEPDAGAPPAPPRAPSALYTYVALPLYLFVVTLLPRVQELRADALALRRDAICSLAHKWEQLAQSGRPVRRAKPRILEHPYARRVLATQTRQP